MSTPERKVSTSASASPFTALAHCEANACARDRLFSAAINLFYRNGIRAVSVDAIAAEAGTTKVTFYRVFESKDDLVVQVLEEQSRRFWQWWDAIVAQHPGEPRKQIEELIARFQRRDHRRRSVPRLCRRERGRRDRRRGSSGESRHQEAQARDRAAFARRSAARWARVNPTCSAMR